MNTEKWLYGEIFFLQALVVYGYNNDSYCWWKKSCTSWYVAGPIIYRGFIHPSQPSTVSQASKLPKKNTTQFGWEFSSPTFTLSVYMIYIYMYLYIYILYLYVNPKMKHLEQTGRLSTTSPRFGWDACKANQAKMPGTPFPVEKNQRKS